MTPQQAKKFLKDNDIKFILAQFVDIHGAAKAKAVPVEHLDMVLTDGAGFAGFALWGFGMGPHGPDYMAVGDLDTLQIIPWMPGFARMATWGHVRGKPYAYDSRLALKNALDALAKKGLTLYTGIEPEFMLLKRGADGSIGPCDDTDTLEKPCYDYKGLARSAAFLERLVDSLRRVGIDVYQIDHEDANGQFEVNFTYADALTTADRHIYLQDGGLRDRQPDGHDRHVHAQAVLQPHRHRRPLPHLGRRRRRPGTCSTTTRTRTGWGCRRWAISSWAACCITRMR